MRNSWVCVDANLVIRLVADPRDGVVERLWEQWDGERRQLAAPTLLFYEVTNALYRYQREGLLSASAVRLALRAALSLPVRLLGGPDLYWRALDGGLAAGECGIGAATVDARGGMWMIQHSRARASRCRQLSVRSSLQ